MTMFRYSFLMLLLITTSCAQANNTVSVTPSDPIEHFLLYFQDNYCEICNDNLLMLDCDLVNYVSDYDYEFYKFLIDNECLFDQPFEIIDYMFQYYELQPLYILEIWRDLILCDADTGIENPIIENDSYYAFGILIASTDYLIFSQVLSDYILTVPDFENQTQFDIKKKEFINDTIEIAFRLNPELCFKYLTNLVSNISNCSINRDMTFYSISHLFRFAWLIGSEIEENDPSELHQSFIQYKEAAFNAFINSDENIDPTLRLILIGYIARDCEFNEAMDVYALIKDINRNDELRLIALRMIERCLQSLRRFESHSFDDLPYDEFNDLTMNINSLNFPIIKGSGHEIKYCNYYMQLTSNEQFRQATIEYVAESILEIPCDSETDHNDTFNITLFSIEELREFITNHDRYIVSYGFDGLFMQNIEILLGQCGEYAEEIDEIMLILQ